MVCAHADGLNVCVCVGHAADMNEVQNFCTGMFCVPPNATLYPAAYNGESGLQPQPQASKPTCQAGLVT